MCDALILIYAQDYEMDTTMGVFVIEEALSVRALQEIVASSTNQKARSFLRVINLMMD